jgi:hypothetical protein
MLCVSDRVALAMQARRWSAAAAPGSCTAGTVGRTLLQQFGTGKTCAHETFELSKATLVYRADGAVQML